MPVERSPDRLLIIAFAAVAAGFIGVTAYSESRVARLDIEARSIATDTTPAIQRLATARAELRFLENALRRRATDPSSVPPEMVNQSLARLQKDLSAYFALPVQPAEEAPSTALRTDFAALSQTVERALTLPGPSSLVGLDVALGRADGHIIELLDVNADAARLAALHIEEARKRAAQLTFALDALVLLFTALAAWLVRTNLQIRERMMARRLAELEQFATRVAHDVLSPLSAVNIALDLGASRAPDEQVARMMERGRGGLKRVRRVVDGLLGFARAGAGPEPGARARVREVVTDVVAGCQPAAEEARVALTAESGAVLSSEKAEVACSPGVLTSLLMNLIGNALKYMDEVKERRVTVRVLDRGHALRFEVEDTGPGLPPELGARVFQPYVRASQEQPGLGLGLATVMRLAQGHGGRVGVEATPGHGCRFWFELPRAEPATS
ncbi:MAG TPA: HAMP domain-containing sensor histidine kinase [Polyangia bacterium]